MAKSRDNVVMQGASGKVGRNLVFRQRGDQTIIAKRPRMVAGGRELTPKQQQVQNRFLNASLYAKQAIQDPELKAAYAKKATINQTAYNVAFKDFFARPEVRLLNDSGYLGNVADEITFLVRDILKVTAIEFEILDQDETVIEAGQAEPTDEENTGWKYIVSAQNVDYANAIYRITMLDTPKNITEVIKAYGEDML
ncbi:hypothetical protein [Sphingobacterium gobiense]|uniref:Uncharacterized protein n=1 Tax=Sphingobacterium gobiense TaxID=1382456 RepID=A0A2S9JNG9_9SPHI|nr:hypothetical protein [Sphingobacterium gobiense]PRD54710.1 hypothetical protein C5749_14855 [Sphingobacterium gobiense]